MESQLDRLYSTFRALHQASEQLDADTPSTETLNGIIESGLARPDDDELLSYWFARYLSVRQSLWNLINDCIDSHDKQAPGLSDEQVWSHFVIGYCSACLLIRNDQIFLFDIANHSVVQRKFNEAFDEYRIPRKQYTRIFSAFVDRRDALRLYDAIHDAKKNRLMLHKLCSDPLVGDLAKALPVFESWVDARKRTYLQRLLAYLSHKWRRKSVVVLNNMLSRAVENVGRAASELVLPIDKRVSNELRKQMIDELQPGDILITRHDTAFTNLFIPGFWPHAALYVGTVAERESMGVDIQADTAAKWTDQVCILEALKDGVRFRPVTETLAVDNFIVLRPNLNAADIKSGIERVVHHEGKLYNFDFDFFSSERLVCSEVVYRAFDGIGNLRFPLTERAGRHTLSPEDLVNFALQTDYMKVVGVFGVGASRSRYTTGKDAENIVNSTVDAGSSFDSTNMTTGMS